MVDGTVHCLPSMIPTGTDGMVRIYGATGISWLEFFNAFTLIPPYKHYWINLWNGGGGGTWSVLLWHGDFPYITLSSHDILQY